jgi:hypothetical protein
MTPFIGAGIGVSRNTISGFTDINTPTAGVAYAPEASKWQMAYALHAGLGYKVTNNLTLELSYRYLHVGNAASGDIVTYTGVNAVVNPMEFRGISSNDVRVGIRWQCCEPQAPDAAAGPDAPRLIFGSHNRLQASERRGHVPRRFSFARPSLPCDLRARGLAALAQKSREPMRSATND